MTVTAAQRREAKTSRGEQTRRSILDAALGLLVERGYEGTTMRAVAAAAGVSLGNAYYYYRSKEHLVQGFYGRTHDEHLAACEEVLATERDLGRRLAGVMRAKIDTLAPYHRFAAVLFKTAADPGSPLHPLSDASRPVRAEATALFAEVLRGSSARVPAALEDELPNLLWLYHMGVVLFWIHDRSPGCAASYRLAARTAALVARLIELSFNPLVRPLVRSVLALLAEIREPLAPAAGEGDGDDEKRERGR